MSPFSPQGGAPCAARLTALPPGATLGVLGGGQLGRMFVHAAQRMGYFTAVLDPDADSPAGRVSHHHIHTDYTDVDGLARLAGLADAVTTEFENVPAPSLEHLAAARAGARRRADAGGDRPGPHPREGATSCAAASPARPTP